MPPTRIQLRSLAVGVCLLALACGAPRATSDGGGPNGTCANTQCGDSCVDTASDVHHCGDCARDCAGLPNVDPAGVACSGGACVVSGHCQAGFGNCSGDPTTGCETALTTPTACGACGVSCAEPTPVCTQDGTGAYHCASGCMGGTPDRCELRCVDLHTDPGFCGTCTTACPAPQDGSPACDAGVCDIACNAGFHACSGACASNGSTATCGGSCTPCAPPANATATCDGGACGYACSQPFADCDQQAANGCEANTQIATNDCGRCGNVCPSTNGQAFCDGGACDISSCSVGFANCDGNPANGCETNVTTSANDCGGCGTVCTTANGTPACDGGRCDVGGCAVGWGNCDGLPGNGCETDTTTTPANCGACGNACALPHATPSCVNSVCRVQSCDMGWADCDNNPANGCEVDITGSANNCGGCGNVCTVANGTPGCAMALCTVAGCNAPFADCDHQPGNGCEVDTGSSTANCGACNNACAPANGTGACMGGGCSIAACTPGFSDCDSNVTNGCETDTRVSPANCGTCGRACSVTNGTAGCAAGSCTVAACNPGFGDCDSSPNNGCETNLNTTPSSCGSCGRACTVANGAPGCVGGACTVASCNPGFADCDNNPANGCETNLNSTPSSCGTCGRVCSTPNGAPGCIGGNCTTAACNAGFADCNGLAADGCETNTNTSPFACGVCNNVCSEPNATAACVGGSCAVGACNPGFADCNSQPVDGCEVSVGSDPNNCGTCGRVCNLPNATASCLSGGCAIAACNPGWADCNGLASDGCEVNVLTSPNNCGVCGRVCNTPNGTPACNTGNCAVGSCNPGYANCNGVVSDGCEVNTATDLGNCGVCGNNCTATCSANVTATACTAGACQVVGCTASHFNVDGVCSNGCECTTTGTSAACAAPSSLGVLNVGQTTTYTGNLVPSGTEAWLVVTFSGNTNPAYHPHVTMTAGTGEFAFDIRTDCAGTLVSCGVEGGGAAAVTDWESFVISGTGYYNPIPPVGANGTVLIHVFRRVGQALTCNNYTLTISN